MKLVNTEYYEIRLPWTACKRSYIYARINNKIVISIICLYYDFVGSYTHHVET